MRRFSAFLGVSAFILMRHSLVRNGFDLEWAMRRGRRSWVLMFLGAAMTLAGAPGCDDRSATVDDSTSTAGPAATAPGATQGQSSAIETEGGMVADLHRRANNGDVSAMLTLARTYESRTTEKDQAEARRWYEKAAAAGDAGARESLRMLDASAGAATRPGGATTGPAGSASGGSGTASAATTGPTELRSVPADPTRLSWDDVTHSFDTTGIETGSKTTPDGQWIGLATAKDKTLVLAAIGPSQNDLQRVRAVVRIKNTRDPNSSPRIGQVTAIANMITRNNVSRWEMGDWIANYLRTQQTSPPIFRNGWRIQVTGPEAEGAEDQFKSQGAAVVVELRR